MIKHAGGCLRAGGIKKLFGSLELHCDSYAIARVIEVHGHDFFAMCIQRDTDNRERSTKRE